MLYTLPWKTNECFWEIQKDISKFILLCFTDWSLFICFLCAIFAHINTAIWCCNWGNPLFFKSLLIYYAGRRVLSFHEQMVKMLIWLKLTFSSCYSKCYVSFRRKQKIYHPLAFSSRWVYGVDNILLLTNNYNQRFPLLSPQSTAVVFTHSKHSILPNKWYMPGIISDFWLSLLLFLPIILFDSRDKVGSKGTGRQGMSIALTEYFTWSRDWAINMLQVFYCISSSQLLHPYLKLRKLVLRDIKYLFKIIQTVSGKSGIWTQVFPDPKVHDWFPLRASENHSYWETDSVTPALPDFRTYSFHYLPGGLLLFSH